MADDDNPLWSGLFPNLLTAWNAPNVRPQGNPLASAVMTNPVGTQYAGPSMGMPQGPFDPIVGMGPNGVPITATQADAMRARTQAGADIATTAVLGMTGDAPGKPPGFTAYHGSPHSFDAFDASKIGTGEGAQAYGHGLYTAQSEAVAQQYRDQLRWKGANWDDPQVLAQNAIDRAGGDRAAAAANLQGSLDSTINFYRGKVPAAQAEANQNTAQAVALLRGTETITGKPPTPGHMYEVQVNADPAHFLDWDKPLSEQSKHVQQALSTFGIKPPSASFSVRPVEGGHAVDYIDSRGNPATSSRVFKTPEEAQRQAQITMQMMNRDPTGGQLYEHPNIVPGSFRDSAAAAAKLRDAGIPGIRYLDGGSRASGEGTHNHVIFDAASMAILRKYGLAGLMAGGGAAAATQGPQQ